MIDQSTLGIDRTSASHRSAFCLEVFMKWDRSINHGIGRTTGSVDRDEDRPIMDLWSIQIISANSSNV
ncbi:unnamed protein product [Cochlearia groenlandica]